MIYYTGSGLQTTTLSDQAGLFEERGGTVWVLLGQPLSNVKVLACAQGSRILNLRDDWDRSIFNDVQRVRSAGCPTRPAAVWPPLLWSHPSQGVGESARQNAYIKMTGSLELRVDVVVL